VNRTQSFIKFVKDFLEGPDAKKPISIPELVELHNKKYPENKIKRLADGGYGSIANSALNYNPKLKNKLNLISGNIARRALEDAPLSGLLEGTGYTRKNLITEIKEGKTLREIADNLYKNNKSYFDKLPIREFKDKGVTRKLDRVTQIINTLSGNVSTDLNRGKVKPNFKENKELQKILNTTNLKKEKQLKNALSDVKNFINKNKNKYSKAIDKGGFGVPYKFQEDILNFVEKKYPNLISISDGKAGREPVLKGQRLLPNILFGKKESKLRTTMGGEYARNTNLKRMIFKSLNLPFDLKEGEGVYNAKNYNSLVKKLLPAAQKKGFVPKTYVDKRGIKRLITANNYNNYVRYKSTDPLFEVFGKQIYFSPEHTGGLKRAVLLNDPEALRTVAPMQSFREEIVSKNPNIEKGQSFDKKITGQISNIINSSDLERPKFIQAANNLAKEAAEKYGVPQATYSWDNVNKKLITKYPKINLESSLLDKVKSAINNFISNDGIKKPVFKKLPKKIQEAVLLTNEGKSATSSIQSHLKDLRLPGGPNLLSRIATKGGVGAVLAVIGLSALGGGSAEATEVSQQQINQPTVSEPLKYDATQGSIVNANTDQTADQNQILEYIKDNPLKVTAGTSLGFGAQEVPGAYKAARDLGRGRVRSTLGISGAIRPILTTFGTPLLTGLYEGAIGAKRLEEGETMTDVLTDPLGPALGLSLMEPLSKMSGVVKGAKPTGIMGGITQALNPFNFGNVGTARPGLTSKILRMGLSPMGIRALSKGGLYGVLALSALAGYDQYNKYQNEEGMVYNFLND